MGSRAYFPNGWGPGCICSKAWNRLPHSSLLKFTASPQKATQSLFFRGFQGFGVLSASSPGG